MTGTETSDTLRPLISATNVLARTMSRVVTPNTLERGEEGGRDRGRERGREGGRGKREREREGGREGREGVK